MKTMSAGTQGYTARAQAPAATLPRLGAATGTD